MGVRAGREDAIMPDCVTSARACRLAARIPLPLPALALLAAGALASEKIALEAKVATLQTESEEPGARSTAREAEASEARLKGGP
jgi:hypothetical protein